jgi:hypothetical protein
MDNRSFFQKLDSIVNKTEERLTKLMRGALMQMMDEATETQPSVKYTGGSFEISKIPLLSEELWDSLVTTIDGQSPSSNHPMSYVAKINSMKLGDRISFVWTAPYARRIEFGFHGVDSLGRFYNVKGRLFATTAYNRLPVIYRSLARMF